MPKRVRKSLLPADAKQASFPIVPVGDTVEQKLRSLMEHPLYSDPVDGRLRDHVGELYRRAYPGEARADATGRTEIAAPAIRPEDVAPFDPSGGDGGTGGTVHVCEHTRDGHKVSAYDRAAPGGGSGTQHQKPHDTPQGGISPPTRRGRVRGVDGWGDGGYGAKRKRNGSEYAHQGTDFAAEPGEDVLSTISGTVIRIDVDPYGDGKFTGVIIRSDDGYEARTVYVKPNVGVGARVERGAPIGTAQDLRQKYPGITNHVHTELWKGKVRAGIPVDSYSEPIK